jgi:carbamate kinase
MTDAIVILVHGEVLAGEHDSTIPDQRRNAGKLAEGLLPILQSNLRVAVLHGNKPQVGFVLFRAELASHILHSIPLDVCGADTQGATGYMISQALMNILRKNRLYRNVISVLTQTVVDSRDPLFHQSTKAIGPWFDRSKAEQHRQTRGWHIVEEPGLGYRRAVPAPPPLEIVEIEDVKQLVESGTIVITAGGGGIPVIRTEDGRLEGVEAVVDTDQVACMLADHLQAKVMLIIVEKDDKFLLSRLSVEEKKYLTLQEVEEILAGDTISSNMVRAKLQAATKFLGSGGEQVIISTLRKLPSTLAKESGLWIGVASPTFELFGNC